MPERTCVGCRGRAEQAELRRFVRLPSGEIVPDVAGRRPGRGAYLHRDPGCAETARRRRSLERALGGSMPGPGVNSGVPS